MTKGLLREVLAEENARFNRTMWYQFSPVFNLAFELRLAQTMPIYEEFPIDSRPKDTSVPSDSAYNAAQLVALVANARDGCERKDNLTSKLQTAIKAHKEAQRLVQWKP